MDSANWITNLADTPAQLTYRAELIARKRASVIGSLPVATEAVRELLCVCLGHLETHPAWTVETDFAWCPGGAVVELDREDPLGTLGKLVSEDFCVLQKSPGATEYSLTAGVLCFPAYWALAEKLGQPLTGIHGPVPVYDKNLARRVNRVFEAVRAERPLMRHNWGLSPIAELHTPPQARQAWPELSKDTPLFFRSERQTLRRLPMSEAVVFGIRSTVSPLSGLSPTEAGAMLCALGSQGPSMTDYKGGEALFSSAKQQLKLLAERPE